MSVIDHILETEERARKEDYDRPLSQGERTGIRNYVNTLLSKAKPGNYAWHKLEQRFGLDGDVSMGDYGEIERRYE